jgi:hypothetical protein
MADPARPEQRTRTPLRTAALLAALASAIACPPPSPVGPGVPADGPPSAPTIVPGAVHPPVPGARALAVGASGGCAIIDRTAACFPLASGGVGSAEPAAFPDPVETACGRSHCCARSAAGAVHCRGENALGETGDPLDEPTVDPARVDLPGPARALFAAGRTSCAALEDGTLRCWGVYRFRGGSMPPEGFPWAAEIRAPADVVDVVAADRHACLRTARGEVLCWGADRAALGPLPETGYDEQRPAPLPGGPWRDVAVGAGFTLLARPDGTVEILGVVPEPFAADAATGGVRRVLADGEVACLLRDDAPATCLVGDRVVRLPWAGAPALGGGMLCSLVERRVACVAVADGALPVVVPTAAPAAPRIPPPAACTPEAPAAFERAAFCGDGRIETRAVTAPGACAPVAYGFPNQCAEGPTHEMPVEMCDGSDRGNADCRSLGFETGEAACDDDCLLDVGDCGPRCPAADGLRCAVIASPAAPVRAIAAAVRPAAVAGPRFLVAWIEQGGCRPLRFVVLDDGLDPVAVGEIPPPIADDHGLAAAAVDGGWIVARARIGATDILRLDLQGTPVASASIERVPAGTLVGPPGGPLLLAGDGWPVALIDADGTPRRARLAPLGRGEDPRLRIDSAWDGQAFVVGGERAIRGGERTRIVARVAPDGAILERRIGADPIPGLAPSVRVVPPAPPPAEGGPPRPIGRWGVAFAPFDPAAGAATEVAVRYVPAAGVPAFARTDGAAVLVWPDADRIAIDRAAPPFRLRAAAWVVGEPSR